MMCPQQWPVGASSPARSKEHYDRIFGDHRPHLARVHGSRASSALGREGVDDAGDHRAVIDLMELTEAQRSEMLASGQPRTHNRIGWALSALARAEALTRPGHARVQIADAGRRLLEEYPAGITDKQLSVIPSYQAHDAYRSYPTPAKLVSAETSVSAGDSEIDALAQMEAGERRLHSDLVVELVERLCVLSSESFEKAVFDLLAAMGYGAGDSSPQPFGDGRAGLVTQDAFGLDRVYVQARHHALGNMVKRSPVERFAGAMKKAGATRGVFITVSPYAKEALEFAKILSGSADNTRIVLIDGERLARLMIKYGVGVQSVRTFTVGVVDEDYFG